MKNRSWKSILFAGAVALAFAIVLNPEVRAMMLLAEVLGFDVLVLLVFTQARSILMMVGPMTTDVARRACKIGSALSGRALQASLSLPPQRLFAVLVSSLLLTMAFLLQCRLEDAA